MKILVTGAAGFIGSYVCRHLLDRGDEVLGLDNLNDYYDVNLKYGRLGTLGIFKDDIDWYKFVGSSEYSSFRFVRMNLEDKQAMRMLFANEQVKHLIYASSSSVYGLNGKVPFSEKDSIAHPVSLYAATKKSNELMAHTYSHLYGIPSTGLRFFTVYGPWGRPDMSPFLFADAMLHHRPIKVFNNGDMLRDFTYVDDIVEGVLRVIDHIPSPDSDWQAETPDPSTSTAPYKIYNIGNSHPVKLMDFIQAIEEAIGYLAEKIFLPMQPGDVYQTNADTTALQNELGFKPNKSIREGVKETIEWYRSFYQL